MDATSVATATIAAQEWTDGALMTTDGIAVAYHSTPPTEKPGTAGPGLLTSVVREIVTRAVTPAPARHTTVSHIVTPREGTTAVFPPDGAEGGSFQAFLGGIIAAMLLVLVCTTALLVCYTCRHQGAYFTKEEEEEDEEESMGSFSSLPKDRDISDED